MKTIKFLVDGVDRLGKSTLIENIQHKLGYHLVIHYDKPKELKYYSGSQYLYQLDCNNEMFNLIEDTHLSIIFDRTHLGELVYAPIYRGYPGDYVLDLENITDTSKCRLILLTTSDMSVGKDDGRGFDWSKRQEEQNSFVKAFHKSTIQDKVLIDVSNGQGGYRDAQEILAEALKLDVQTKKADL